jgi:hypothetical protein
MGIEGAQGVALSQAGLEGGPGSRIDRSGKGPTGEIERSSFGVDICDGERSDLGARSSVEQCEKSGEPFVRAPDTRRRPSLPTHAFFPPRF